MTRYVHFTRPVTTLATTLCFMAMPALGDTITGNLTVRDRLCVGSECNTDANGEFGVFDPQALKLKSVAPWIKFQDTSAGGTVPTNDWMLRINGIFGDTDDYLAVEDTNGGTVPFRIDARAPTNALRVATTGNIGLGTGLPQRDLHIRRGANPTIRLEQDGSGGDTPGTWDIGGNGSNFYIVKDGNLPFRVLSNPGNDTNGNALVIASDGDVGVGTSRPQAKLHVAGTSMLIQNQGRVNFTLSDTSDPGPDFRTQLTAGTARFSFVGTGAPEMELFQSGDLAIRGRYISAGTQLTVPDYVFDEDYVLRPLAEVQSFIDANSHLPGVPSAADIAEDGLDLTEMQMTLLKKIEELTLYTLKQEAEMAALRRRLDALDGQ